MFRQQVAEMGIREVLTAAKIALAERLCFTLHLLGTIRNDPCTGKSLRQFKALRLAGRVISRMLIQALFFGGVWASGDHLTIPGYFCSSRPLCHRAERTARSYSILAARILRPETVPRWDSAAFRW